MEFQESRKKESDMPVLSDSPASTRRSVPMGIEAIARPVIEESEGDRTCFRIPVPADVVSVIDTPPQRIDQLRERSHEASGTVEPSAENFSQFSGDHYVRLLHIGQNQSHRLVCQLVEISNAHPGSEGESMIQDVVNQYKSEKEKKGNGWEQLSLSQKHHKSKQVQQMLREYGCRNNLNSEEGLTLVRKGELAFPWLEGIETKDEMMSLAVKAQQNKDYDLAIDLIQEAKNRDSNPVFHRHANMLLADLCLGAAKRLPPFHKHLKMGYLTEGLKILEVYRDSQKSSRQELLLLKIVNYALSVSGNSIPQWALFESVKLSPISRPEFPLANENQFPELGYKILKILANRTPVPHKINDYENIGLRLFAVNKDQLALKFLNIAIKLGSRKFPVAAARAYINHRNGKLNKETLEAYQYAFECAKKAHQKAWVFHGGATLRHFHLFQSYNSIQFKLEKEHVLDMYKKALRFAPNNELYRQNKNNCEIITGAHSPHGFIVHGTRSILEEAPNFAVKTATLHPGIPRAEVIGV